MTLRYDIDSLTRHAPFLAAIKNHSKNAWFIWENVYNGVNLIRDMVTSELNDIDLEDGQYGNCNGLLNRTTSKEC